MLPSARPGSWLWLALVVACVALEPHVRNESALDDLEVVLASPTADVVYPNNGTVVIVVEVWGASPAELCAHRWSVELQLIPMKKVSLTWTAEALPDCRGGVPGFVNPRAVPFQFVIQDCFFGRYQIRWILRDSHGTKRSMSQDYINVLAPTVELSLPECWSLAGGSAPGEDCAWFTAALNPRAPVLLSRTELGSPNGEGGPGLDHGTWGWLVGSFGGESLLGNSALLEVLPRTGQLGGSHASCAVVGSSEAMSGAGFGAEIDGHAVVVRVNWAPTAGRERDVGVRTDVRVIATWPSEGGAGDAQGGGAGGGGGAAAGPEQLLLRLSQGAPDVARFLARARTRGAAGRGDAIISPSFLGYLHSNFFGDVTASGSLSTGIVAVLWAVHACKIVDTYGFTAGSPLYGTGYRRYWRDAAAADQGWLYSETHGEHDWVGEHRLHDRLERARALRRRTRSPLRPA